MQYNRKMINGVVFLEEQADYLLLLGKEGLYTVQAENDHWNVHYTLPGDTSNLDKQFISKDEALQDVYEMDIWRRNRWKFLPMKELRTRLKKLLMEAGFTQAELAEMSDGLHIYDNPVGVLTNNPPFPQQMFQLNNYMYLSPKQPRNTFCENLALDAYSRGMGGLGLPGDLSSSSRFVRVAFTKVNAISGESEEESVSQFFHILGSVDQQRGCCEVADGKYEITLYTSCCNVTKGIYYYNTYENHQISAVDMHVENLDSDKMICYPVIQGERINYQNK